MSRHYPWPEPQGRPALEASVADLARQIAELTHQRDGALLQIRALEEAARESWLAGLPRVRGTGGEPGYLVRHTDASVWVWWPSDYDHGHQVRHAREGWRRGAPVSVQSRAPWLDLSSLPVLP